MTLQPEGVMSQMLFSYDTELTLRAACVLINSGTDGEELPDLPALDTYLDGFGWTGRRDHDVGALEVSVREAVIVQQLHAEENLFAHKRNLRLSELGRIHSLLERT